MAAQTALRLECTQNQHEMQMTSLTRFRKFKSSIPGHTEGNEVADSLANAGSASNVYEPSPYIPIGWIESI